MEANIKSERIFVIVGHKATTSPFFSLNDLPGSTGRMDILARCVNSSFMLSHGLRKNVKVYLILKGGEKETVVEFVGSELKYMNPDERNIASLIRIGLKNVWPSRAKYSTPGVYAYNGSLELILNRHNSENIYYLHETGEKQRELGPGVYVMGDRDDLTEEEEKIVMMKNPVKISLGDVSYHSDHCITVVNYLIDTVKPPSVD